MSDDIWNGIAKEFSDLPSLTSLTQICVRLFLGVLLGGIIGFDRERRGKNAGIRTHMLVCVGTAFAVAVPQQAGMDFDQLSRIIQGIMSGIGFLGAGTVLKLEADHRVEGLTTAASIWLVASIGIAVGLGREATAVLGTVAGLTILLAASAAHKQDRV